MPCPWGYHGCTGHTATSAVAVPPGSSRTAARAVVMSMTLVVLGRNAIGESFPALARAAARSWEHRFGSNSVGRMGIGLAAAAAVAAGGRRNLHQSSALSRRCNSRSCSAQESYLILYGPEHGDMKNRKLLQGRRPMQLLQTRLK